MRKWNPCNPCCQPVGTITTSISSSSFSADGRTFYFHTNCNGRHSIDEWVNSVVTINGAGWGPAYDVFNGQHILVNQQSPAQNNGNNFGLGSAGTHERNYRSRHSLTIGHPNNRTGITALFDISGFADPTDNSSGYCFVSFIAFGGISVIYKNSCNQWVRKFVTPTNDPFVLANSPETIEVSVSF